MLLHINDTMLVADVQEDFSDSYPLLKIEFYVIRDGHGTTRPVTHRVSPDEELGAIRNTHDAGSLEILSWYATGRVERAFKEKFGLNVHVFRKEAGTWVQSGSTDSYTLVELTARAQQARKFAKIKQRVTEYEYL